MIPIGTRIRSTRNPSLAGVVIGYGSLLWPSWGETPGDVLPQAVYIVQVRICSNSSIGPACCVLHADYVEVVS